MNTATLRRLAPRVALAALLAWTASAGWQWFSAARSNREVARQLASAPVALKPADAATALKPADATASAEPAPGRPEVAFATGIAQAGAGRTLDALATWRRVGQDAAPALAADAWFNSANLYLREARRLRDDGGQLDRSGAFAELAKDAYRRALALRPDDWDARYNLQRALQWFPDADDDEESLPPAPARERAVTTMRASSLGLP